MCFDLVIVQWNKLRETVTEFVRIMRKVVIISEHDISDIVVIMRPNSPAHLPVVVPIGAANNFYKRSFLDFHIFFIRLITIF